MCNGRTCGGAGRGECTDGGCRCHPRWSGAGCCEPEEICPDDYLCYHGVCNERGHCDCDLGYTGDDCSLGPFFVGNEDDCEEEEEEKKSGKSGKRTCAARRAAPPPPPPPPPRSSRWRRGHRRCSMGHRRCSRGVCGSGRGGAERFSRLAVSNHQREKRAALMMPRDERRPRRAEILDLTMNKVES